MRDIYSFARMLLRCLPVLLFILLDTLAQYAAPLTDTLKWKNIASRYKNFVEVRPILVNDGKESIFLSRIWPHGSAQLQRWNETTGKWETGDWGIGCGTVSKATIPIEIKPRTEQEIHVYWQLSMDDWERPRHFVVNSADEKRPLKGKYRFFLRYAKLPWTLAHRPGKIYILESPEFQVTTSLPDASLSIEPVLNSMVKTKAIVLILICLTTLTYSAHVRAQDSRPRALFSVDKNGKSGYIDDKGKLVIPLIFDGAGDFSEGLAPVKVHDQWGYIDETGKIVIAPLFSGAYEFSEGLARVQVEGDKYGMHGKWGFIDIFGNWVIKPQYGELTGVDSESQGFREGLAIVEIDYQKGFIDKLGRLVIKPQFSYVYHFSEGLVSVSAGLDEKWGYIDRSGRWVIQPQFNWACPFSEGLASVDINGRCGYIDKAGSVVLQPQDNFGDCSVIHGHFNEGLSRWKIGGKYGFIDKSGTVVISPKFDLAEDFTDGMARIAINGSWGFIARNGDIVIKPRFQHVKSFVGGLACVITEAGVGYIDKTGRYVWDPTR